MTILEAAIKVLDDANRPMSAKDIYDEIVRADLYKFGAKSPRSVLSGTLRNHMKKAPEPKLEEVGNGVYRLRR